MKQFLFALFISICFNSVQIDAQNHKVNIDSLCADMKIKNQGFMFIFNDNNFMHTYKITNADIDDIIKCYSSGRENKLSKNNIYTIKLLQINWLVKNREIGKAIIIADEYKKEYGSSTDFEDVRRAYEMQMSVYSSAGLVKEQLDYCNSMFHTLLKLGDLDTKRDIIRGYSWICFLYGKNSEEKAYLDTAAHYQKLLLRGYRGSDKWVDAELFKTYMMTLRDLNRNEELVTIGWEASAFLLALNTENNLEDTDTKRKMLGATYGYIGLAYIRMGKKDSAQYYLTRPFIYDNDKIPTNCYSSNEGKYIHDYHVREKVRMHFQFNEPSLAIKLLDDALFSKQPITATENLYGMYDFAAPHYFNNKLFEKSALCYKYSMKYKDSVAVANEKIQKESDRINNLLKVNYAQTIAKHEQERLISESNNEKSKKNIILTCGIIVLVIMFIFLYYIQNRYKLVKQQKIIIEQKEIETKKQNQIITSQKHLVEEKQKEMLDSINYAKQIQKTLLANHELVNQTIPDSFLMFEPKDIVSGDFYWATKKDNRFYLAVCDSTGHGVPGAFMSLLNISFLNEAISEKGLIQPNEIFDFVRQRLITQISQEGRQDGMDGILICIHANGKINYAAANNTPLVVSGNIIKDFPGDKMPVGKGEQNKAFTNYELDAKKGDMLYLYTDGYADQFGGPKGKKFKYKKLNELILANAQLDINKQKEILQQSFLSWKGNLEQIDDVCVLGFRL